MDLDAGDVRSLHQDQIFPLHTSFTTTADINQALLHEVRSAENKVRDDARKPLQTLNFFEVTPQSTVVEVWPGSGWYTEILAPLLADQGKLYAAHFSDKFTLISAEYRQKGLTAYQAKLASHPVYKNVTVTEFSPLADSPIAPAASVEGWVPMGFSAGDRMHRL